MPRKKNDYRKDPTHAPASAATRAAIAAPPGAQRPGGVPAVGDRQCPFAILASCDGGYLRMSPHPLDDKLYFKWKYTSGAWDNHYCFISGRVAEFEALAWALLRYMEDVDLGVRRPTPDRYYNGR